MSPRVQTMSYLRNDTIRLEAEIRDFDNNLVDPPNVEVNIYKPDGSPAEDPITPSRESEGHYYVDYAIPETADEGPWRAEWSCMIQSKPHREVAYFSVTSGILYSTVEMVKQRLELNSEDARFNEEIRDLIVEADETIDNLLKKFIETPLSDVPSLIRRASADLATGLFRRRRAPPDEKISYTELGLEKVNAYITENFKARFKVTTQ